MVSIDGLELKEFDYIDIGTMLESSGAVPVVIKSLIFPGKCNGEAKSARAVATSVTSSTTPSAAIAPPAVRAAKRTGMRLAAKPMAMPIRCSTSVAAMKPAA